MSDSGALGNPVNVASCYSGRMLPLVGTLALLFVAAALLVLGVHALVRPPPRKKVRVTDALSDLRAVGGRQRFRVQLVELAALFSVWAIGLAVFTQMPGGVWPVSTWTALASVIGGLVIGTWWLWRRGALREAVASPDEERP